MPSQNTYENIFETQGLTDQDLNNGDWTVYEIKEEDSLAHAGEMCAIPTQVTVPCASEAYDLMGNGAIVSTEGVKIIGSSFIAPAAVIEKNVTVNSSVVGAKSRMHEGSRAIASQVGPRSNIGAKTILYYAELGPNVEIDDTPDTSDSLALVHKSQLGSDVHLGSNCHITLTNMGERVSVGHHSKTGNIETGLDGTKRRLKKGRTFIRDEVVIGENVQIATRVSIGAKSIIGDEVVLRSGVNAGFGVTIGDKAVIGRESKLEHHAVVKPGKNIKPDSIIKAPTQGVLNKLKTILGA